MIKKNIKLIIRAISIIGIIVLCLIYTRPQILEQHYPYLDFAQCSEIKGYCFTAPNKEDKPFSIKSTDADFYKLVEMIRGTAFKMRLENLLPHGTKTHSYSDGDYGWTVILYFENVKLPDRSKVSGACLDIGNFFGDLSISFNGEQMMFLLISKNSRQKA